uniref:Uncharacterized protein n=1 Tax=Anopheles epiroticus TaxID=199890 RepID=A0A182PMI4_9DIPT
MRTQTDGAPEAQPAADTNEAMPTSRLFPPSCTASGPPESPLHGERPPVASRHTFWACTTADRVAREPHHRRGGGASVRRTSEAGRRTFHTGERAGVGASRQSDGLHASVEDGGRVQTHRGDVVSDRRRIVLRVHVDVVGGEGDALLRRFHHGTIVSTKDGRAADCHRTVTIHNTVSRRQKEVVGDDGRTAQTGTGREVAQQRHLVRELAGGRLLSVHNAHGGSGEAQVLHLRRQTLPVVIELLDRFHLRPVDVDPFGTGQRADGQQAGNHKRSSDLHPCA